MPSNNTYYPRRKYDTIAYFFIHECRVVGVQVLQVLNGGALAQVGVYQYHLAQTVTIPPS